MRPFTLPLPLAVLTLTAALLLPSAAEAGFQPGGATPGICTGDAFADRIGTSGSDVLRAERASAERVYGGKGADQLSGSATRAACLFGGLDPDLLLLIGGGGVAFGEGGADVLVGSTRSDVLDGGPGADTVSGGGGGDLMRGGTGVDAFLGAGGDDTLLAADGRRELLLCGGGDDSAQADADDAAFGCERVERRAGRRLTGRRAAPAIGRPRTIFRLTFRAPTAGGPGTYEVFASRCGGSAPVLVTAVPGPGRRVRAGQRIRLGLRAPKGGWCPGRPQVVLTRRPACEPGRCVAPLPVEPLAAIRFRVRG